MNFPAEAKDCKSLKEKPKQLLLMFYFHQAIGKKRNKWTY